MSPSTAPGGYLGLVRSFDHDQLSHLPAYQALRQALSDIGNQLDNEPLAGFLEAVRDMALTAPYGDRCPHCPGDVTSMTWPHAATRNGTSIRGRYLCTNGHDWSCTYGIDIVRYL